MTNPFEDPGGRVLILRNDENQHSLWPSSAEVPAGWAVVLPETTRQACLDYVDEHWTDFRPESLVRELRSGGAEHLKPGIANNQFGFHSGF